MTEELNKTRERQVNWESAFRYYCELNQDGSNKNRTDVAVKYNCSESAVAHRSVMDNWAERRQKLHNFQTVAFEESHRVLTEEAMDRHLKVWKSIQAIGLKMLAQFNQELTLVGHKNESSSAFVLKDIVSVISYGIRGERVILGLPNEVKRAEIQSSPIGMALDTSEIKSADEALSKIFQNRI